MLLTKYKELSKYRSKGQSALNFGLKKCYTNSSKLMDVAHINNNEDKALAGTADFEEEMNNTNSRDGEFCCVKD
jgi:hypothetical protein